MEISKVTVRIPKEDLDFAKEYAKNHNLTLTELIDRYIKMLKINNQKMIHPEVEKISDLIPKHINARGNYIKAMERKHS